MKQFWSLAVSVVLALAPCGVKGQPRAQPSTDVPYFIAQKLIVEIKGWPYRDGQPVDHAKLCVHDAGLTLCPPTGDAYFSLRFVVDGKHLRARVLPEDLLPTGELPGVSRENVLEKNGWYVTADYSTNPPHVLLTKEPTKYSRWSVTPSPGNNGISIRNENDLNKDAYLKLPDAFSSDAPADACRPILSSEKHYWNVAAYSVPRKNKPHWIDHKMSYCGFDVFDKVESPIPTPKYYNLRYYWDGTHVRVRLVYDEGQSEEEIAKTGTWYLTADYSATPPAVILTKEPTKNSRWSFLATAPTQRWIYYIKNENDRGKAGWLDVVDTGNGVYKAILSFDNKKKAFQFRDLEEDGGK